MTSVYDFTAPTADGATQPLSNYSGQVLLVVNVASRCGFTPQYEGLEVLQRDLGPKGLQVLGFPSNQFSGQEPGSDAEIQEFCSATYGVSFPVFAKIDVNGPDAAPLYEYLRAEDPGTFGPEAGRLYEVMKERAPEVLGTDAVKWNFTKFLIGRDGAVIRRYESTVTPEELRPDVEAALAG